MQRHSTETIGVNAHIYAVRQKMNDTSHDMEE
jgi:hypothetical protein